MPEFEPGAYKAPAPKENPEPEHAEPQANLEYARRIWREAVPITGTIAEYYLYAQRGLRLDSGIDFSESLRFHPKLYLNGKTAPGMVALMRDVESLEPRAIHRTFLTKAGCKITRKMLGASKGCAVMIDRFRDIPIAPNGAVEIPKTLAIGEGLESTIAGRAFGYQPAWAVGSAGAIAAFPVIRGVDQLFIFAENDAGANQDAILECRSRWVAAGKKVTAVEPTGDHKDLNDEWLGLSALPLVERTETFLDTCDRFWPGAEIVAEPDRELSCSWVPITHFNSNAKREEYLSRGPLCHAERTFGTIKRIGVRAFGIDGD